MLTGLLRSRLTVIWAVLVAATLLSFESAIGFGDAAGRVVGSIVLIIAFVKVRLVGAEFMELRQAPRALQWLFDGWVVVVCGALIAIYWMGAGTA